MHFSDLLGLGRGIMYLHFSVIPFASIPMKRVAALMAWHAVVVRPEVVR